MGKVIERMKRGIRSWLDLEPADPANISIKETLDYEGNAIKNRVWYQGDGNQLQQLYEQMAHGVDRYKFWASKSSPGMEMRKIHTGIPALIVDMLATVTLADIGVPEFKNKADEDIWKAIEEENKFMKRLERVVKETLYIGDGAYKLTYDTAISEYPIPEYFPGDQIEIEMKRQRIQEIIFKTTYVHDHKHYELREHYGYGYIKNHLFHGEQEVDVNMIPQTEGLQDVFFSTYKEDEEGKVIEKGSYMLAVPIMFFESSRWDGRGQSIYDKKIDDFDAVDEAWSQWMDALRQGRSREYIPESLIPRNPKTGQIMTPNAFDNRYIKIGDNMGEGAQNKIDVEQPAIPHESYEATYVTALDQCLQGVISPSTLGIDMKKLDNADAQREKEKATLYTRNAIVAALEEDIPRLAEIAIRAYRELKTEKEVTEAVDVALEFGEYANPSFESQVETVVKAKTGGVMSVEASVEELYGDSKDDSWKKEEVARLKAEQGIVEVEEPAVRQQADGFVTGGGDES